MKLQKMIFLAVALALLPLAGRSATDVATDVAPPPSPIMNAGRDVSRQAHEVVKLVSSGIPNDVVKAYIENAPSTFNLTSDNIIHLQQLGVSGGLLSAMLDHDRSLRQAGSMIQPPGAQAYPPNEGYGAQTQPAPDNGYDNSQADGNADADSYNQLSPYGNWNYVPSYGWAWQPYAGLAYGAYPWGVLGYGYWWNCPGFGWCWFPHSGFFHGFHGGFHSGFHSGFHAGFHSGFHSGFHGSSGGFGRSFSSFRGSTGGFHGGSMGGFHGGSMGGGFGRGGGGGFSGGHGGGGGHR